MFSFYGRVVAFVALLTCACSGGGTGSIDATYSPPAGGSKRLAFGERFYRSYDLKLARDRTLSLTRSLSLSHPIDEHSPLHGLNASSAASQEVELNLMLVGIDDTAMQTVRAKHHYGAGDILWNMRLADILSDAPDGAMVVDLHKFHDVEPVR